MDKIENFVREILEHLNSLRIVDTHEHLDAEEVFRSRHVDFGRLFLHYANSDLVSAGCPPRDVERLHSDPSLSPREKWRLIEPYWQYVRGTGYGRCLERAIRGLYGLDGLSAETVEPLSEAMAARRKRGFYREVFAKAGIAVALWNRFDLIGTVNQLSHKMWAEDYDRTLFVQDLLVPYLIIQEPWWREPWGREILCLDDFLGAIEEQFAAHAAQAAALKIHLAYLRPIEFPDRARSEIEPIFNRLLNAGWEHNESMPSREELMAVQDYLVHFSLRQCAKHGLGVKFHTGLQEGSGNTLANSRPSLLTNLFFKYPNVRFDLYHIAYPFHEELVALAKNFANVAIDFCWMWIINPAAGRRALSDFLDAVPANKIHGFGGDFIFVEGSYAHALMARENIARVLAEKAADGQFDLKRAMSIGRWLLRDNPISWFGLQGKAPPEVLAESV